jgi:hypothetical protein
MTAMNDQARRAAAKALLQLAESDDFRDRADAGRALASFADIPESRQTLQRLLLDAADTVVTRETAEALLRRKDQIGLGTVARALADAEADHADWIADAVHEVFAIYATDRDEAVRTCDELIENGEPAMLLRDLLTAITPVLHPAAGE